MPMNQVLYDTLKARWKKRTQDQWVYFNEKMVRDGEKTGIDTIIAPE